MSKYPNLSEVIKYHPYHIGTFAYHADVTMELLQAVVDGQEELHLDEIREISKLIDIPVSVLICPNRIMLDKNRFKHKQMINELFGKRIYIRECFQSGSLEAETFMRRYWSQLDLFHSLFIHNKASYMRFIGIKERINQCLLSIDVEKQNKGKRGLRNSEKTETLGAATPRES